MSNLTASKFPRTQSPGFREHSYVPDSQSFFVSSFVGQDISSGKVKRWSDTSGSNLRFLGMSLSEITGDSSTKNLIVDESGSTLLGVAVAGATTAAVLVYSSTDNYADLTITPTSNAKSIGKIRNYRSASDCDVELHTPAAYLGVLLP